VPKDAGPSFGPMAPSEGTYTADDEEKIEERLKALGYVE
jgi:hypothetical protein